MLDASRSSANTGIGQPAILSDRGACRAWVAKFCRALLRLCSEVRLTRAVGGTGTKIELAPRLTERQSANRQQRAWVGVTRGVATEGGCSIRLSAIHWTPCTYSAGPAFARPVAARAMPVHSQKIRAGCGGPGVTLFARCVLLGLWVSTPKKRRTRKERPRRESERDKPITVARQTI